jgi:hypothetical protein
VTVRGGACLLLLGAGVAADAQVRPPAVAMVMDLRGAGTILSQAGEQQLALLAELPAGQPVSLKSGAVLVLVTLAKGDSLRIPGPATFQLGPEGHPTDGVSGLKVDAARSMRLKEGLKPAGLAQAGVVASFLGPSPMGASAVGAGRRPEVDLLSPPGPAIRELRPIFRWSAPAPQATYRFRLTTQDGREVFHAEPGQPEVRLPEQASLTPGAPYRWEVVALMPDGKERRASRSFRLIATPDEELLAATRPAPGDPFDRRVLYALLLDRLGVRAEATAAWKQLSSERPGDAVLKARANPLF